MAKKSSKTAHVLSLLTTSNNDNESSDSNEVSAAPHIAESSITESSIDASYLNKKTVQSIEIKNNASDPLSELLRNELEREYEFYAKYEVTHDNIMATPNNNQTATKEEHKMKNNDTANDSNTANTNDNTFNDTADTVVDTVNSANANVNDVTSDNIDATVTVENDSNTSITAGADGLSNSADFADEFISNYILINVMEDLVKHKAKSFAEKLGCCTCTRCISDIIAITLNLTHPKYVVAHKGMLLAKIQSYENQYSADIVAALTKACMSVNNEPRH